MKKELPVRRKRSRTVYITASFSPLILVKSRGLCLCAVWADYPSGITNIYTCGDDSVLQITKLHWRSDSLLSIWIHQGCTGHHGLQIIKSLRCYGSLALPYTFNSLDGIGTFPWDFDILEALASLQFSNCSQSKRTTCCDASTGLR
ncbi:hypothetical protein ECG_09979 [Echinococcus granulosus]|nr:hypothetical protein ECG_09979 [Echinococcus granulosus]